MKGYFSLSGTIAILHFSLLVLLIFLVRVATINSTLASYAIGISGGMLTFPIGWIGLPPVGGGSREHVYRFITFCVLNSAFVGWFVAWGLKRSGFVTPPDRGTGVLNSAPAVSGPSSGTA